MVLCVMSSSGKKTLETDIACVSDKNKGDKNCPTVARSVHCTEPLPSPQKVPHSPPSPSFLQQQKHSVSDPTPIPCPALLGPSPGNDAQHPSPPLVIQEFKRRLKRQQDQKRKKKKRECPTFRAAENKASSAAMTKKRKCPIFRAAEKAAMTKKRECPDYRQKEAASKRMHRASKKKSLCPKELEREIHQMESDE